MGKPLHSWYVIYVYFCSFRLPFASTGGHVLSNRTNLIEQHFGVLCYVIGSV